MDLSLSMEPYPMIQNVHVHLQLPPDLDLLVTFKMGFRMEFAGEDLLVMHGSMGKLTRMDIFQVKN